jgi:hypothetical protein
MPDDTQAPAIDLPAEGAALPAAAAFTFTWHPTGLSLRRGTAPRMYAWRDELVRWSALIPAADAHCPAFGGVGYAVIFSANGQQILRAETARTSYQPTPSAWMHLVAAPGTISMVVEVARFSDNTVTQGPYVDATPRHFTISP